MFDKRALAVVLVAVWAYTALTFTRPWPSPETYPAALAIIIVGLTLWALVFAPVVYFIGLPLYRRTVPKA